MPSKEFGSIFVALCPVCLTSLIVGWDADGDVVPDIPVEDPRIAAIIAARNPSAGVTFPGQRRRLKGAVDQATQLIGGPVVCVCANNVVLRMDPLRGRAVVSWATAEPITGNINHHPPAA